MTKAGSLVDQTSAGEFGLMLFVKDLEEAALVVVIAL